MYVHRTVAAGRGGAGAGIVSFFAHAASRDRLHVAFYSNILNCFEFLLNFIKIQ